MPTENNPAVIYLAPACNENSGDGRDWCADDVFETCECGSEPVRYVIGSDFDRVAAERAALQADLDAKDQRVDELEQALAAVTEKAHELTVKIHAEFGNTEYDSDCKADVAVLYAMAGITQPSVPKCSPFDNSNEPPCTACFARGCNGECMENL